MGRDDYKKADHWSRKARREGFQARSVFKLEEIDGKENLLRQGLRVLDLGASPGSWMKYASQKVGPRGLVAGIDLKPLERDLAENERFLEGDLYETEPEDMLFGLERFDLVMSDMMPNTIGHKASDHLRSIALAERALYIADCLLRPGGHFLVKVFQGAEFESYRAMLRDRFKKVKIKKPRSSRKQSREIYLLGMEKKPSQEGE